MTRVAVLTALLWTLAGGVAEASCAPGKPKERLGQAAGAFVGTVVERNGDAIVFAVEERYKGELPDRLEVLNDNPRSSITFEPPVGARLGLLLRPAGEDGRLRANACETIAPEDLREAASVGGGPCLAPTVIFAASRAGRRIIRLPAVVTDRDGDLRSLTVTWGDGRRTVRRLAGAGDPSRRVVAVSHRYRRPGRRRIAVQVTSDPGPGCGEELERSATGRVTVRPRRAQ